MVGRYLPFDCILTWEGKGREGQKEGEKDGWTEGGREREMKRENLEREKTHKNAALVALPFSIKILIPMVETPY